MTDTTTPAPLTGFGSLSRGRKFRNDLATVLMWAALIVALIPLAFLLYYVTREGMKIMGWKFLTKNIPVVQRTRGPGMAPAIVGTLLVLHVPLGDYLARVYDSPRHLRAEKALYRLIGVAPDEDQRWTRYLGSVLAFSGMPSPVVQDIGQLAGRLDRVYHGRRIGGPG